MKLTVLALDKTAIKIREKLTPQLLKPYWRKLNEEEGAHPLKGHCYVATEAYYHAVGKDKGYTPRVLKTTEGTHWWLQNEEGQIIDLTAEQFGKNAIAYPEGRKIGFLTREPSKRAQIVLESAGLAQKSQKLKR